jgi:hypothetical protein
LRNQNHFLVKRDNVDLRLQLLLSLLVLLVLAARRQSTMFLMPCLRYLSHLLGKGPLDTLPVSARHFIKYTRALFTTRLTPALDWPWLLLLVLKSFLKRTVEILILITNLAIFGMEQQNMDAWKF